MKIRYRVIHQHKSFLEALLKGRTWTDWYLAQHKSWYGWKTIGTYPSTAEAEHCCEEHADGKLTRSGGRIVSEFTQKDDEE